MLMILQKVVLKTDSDPEKEETLAMKAYEKHCAGIETVKKAPLKDPFFCVLNSVCCCLEWAAFSRQGSSLESGWKTTYSPVLQLVMLGRHGPCSQL